MGLRGGNAGCLPDVAFTVADRIVDKVGVTKTGRGGLSFGICVIAWTIVGTGEGLDGEEK